MSEITRVPLRPLKQGSLLRLWIGIAVVILAAVAVAYAGTPSAVTSATGVKVQTVKAGTGPKPTDTDVVLVNYRGTLTNGTLFDEAQRAPFPVNAVVPGFSEGLKQMQKGGKYRLWIPAALGYGAQSPSPQIPANSDLVFDVELVDFKSQAEVQAAMQAQQGAIPPR